MEGKGRRGHVVCVPYPVQGHIHPMMKLAKIIHAKGLHNITFLNTDFNHKRLLKSRGSRSLNGLPSFQFRSIPDGLPPSDLDASQDVVALSQSAASYLIYPFRDLLAELNNDSEAPPVSCIISDGAMTFTMEAAEELGIPNVLFWATSACAYLAYMHYHKLHEMGLTPLKDESYLENGYLEQTLDWMPGGMKGMRLRDFPSFIRTTDPDDGMIKNLIRETERDKKAFAIIINTYDELEHDALHALSSILPPIYPIGPLNLLQEQVSDERLDHLGSNLWKEEAECVQWLDTKEENSVVYVNFGSITTLTSDQVLEFAWGLANSKQAFLWILRSDMVSGDSAVLPPDFLEEIKDRGILAGWCPQEQVLRHPSVGGFLTHSGWNSTLESISYGVPMICWPFFSDQQTNCWFCCSRLEIGMEVDNNVKRNGVEALVRELMVGEKGKDMKMKSLKWKTKAQEAALSSNGSSHVNLDKVIKVHIGVQ